MEYSVFRAILCCSFLLNFISSSGAELNPGYDLQQGLGQMLNRRMSQHPISKRSTSNLVDISMFTDSSTPGKAYSVYVDDTMTRLIIEVKVERSSPVIMLAKPSGLPGPHPKLNGTSSAGTVTATIDVAITAADYGIWKLNKLDANTWIVKIQGESSLDFTYQFLKGSFIQVPLTGDPVQGETYKTVLTVADFSKAKSVDVVQLFIIEKLTAANMMFPTDKGNGKYEIAKLQMLDKDFMIGINGKDNSGHFFRRIKTVKPIALSLSVPAFNDASVKLYENTKLELIFYVKNELSKDQEIDVRIQDTQGFAQSPTIISATLTPGQNYTGKFVITGGLFGVSTDVTITAKPYIYGKKTDGPSVMKTFIVDRNQTTTTSTSTTTSTTTTTTSTTPSTSSPTVTSTPSSSQSTKATQTTGSPAGTSKTNALTASPSSSASSASVSASTNKPGATVAATSMKNTVSSPVGVSAAGSTNAAPAAGTKSPSGSSTTTVSAATNAKASALSASSKGAGQASTAAPSGENKDESFSKGEVFGAAIASGVSAGVLIGVAALVTMGLVFKHSINKSKRKVTPEEKKKKKNNTLSEHNDLTKSSSRPTTPTTTSSISSAHPMPPIISAAPASTKPVPVSTATTFVKNPVSTTTAPSPPKPVSVGTTTSTTQPSKTLVTTNSTTPVANTKYAPISSSKISTDKPENGDRNENAKSPDGWDLKIQTYLRHIKDLAKNKPQNRKHQSE